MPVKPFSFTNNTADQFRARARLEIERILVCPKGEKCNDPSCPTERQRTSVTDRIMNAFRDIGQDKIKVPTARNNR